MRQAERDHRWDRPHVTVLSWYLDHVRHRICPAARAIALTKDWWEWEAIIKEFWHDRFDHTAHFEVDIVTPEPFRTTGEFHQAQIIITQRRLELPELYWVIHDHDLIAYEPHRIPQGAGIEVLHVPAGPPGPSQSRTHNMRPVPEEDDAVTLLARQLNPRPAEDDLFAPTEDIIEGSEEDSIHMTDDGNELPADATWRPCALYRLGLHPVHRRLRWNDAEVLHRQASDYLEVTRHELLTLHHVSHPPRDTGDTEELLLAQVQGEVRPGSTVRYVLVDVEFHNLPPDLVPETVRESKLLVKDVTRKMLLSVLGLVPYCHFVGDACLVWRNHVLVRSDFAGGLNLQHGDYLRISIPPQNLCKEISTRTAALIHHHEFGPADYERFSQGLSDDTHIEQMPNPESRLDHLPFRDEVNLMQLRIPSHEDIHLQVQALREHAIAQDAARADDLLFQQLAQLPPPLRDLHGLFLRAAQAQPEFENALLIMTWYLNHDRARRCNIGRPVPLSSDPSEWLDAIARAWHDELDTRPMKHPTISCGQTRMKWKRELWPMFWSFSKRPKTKQHFYSQCLTMLSSGAKQSGWLLFTSPSSPMQIFFMWRIGTFFVHGLEFNAPAGMAGVTLLVDHLLKSMMDLV